MYRLRGVTLSFTKRKWQTYECLVSKAPWRGGSPPPFGRVGVGFTLHRNTLSSKKLHHTVKFFYLLQHLYNTTFHTSRNVSSFTSQNIYCMKYLAVWKNVCTHSFFVERLQDYRITPLFMRPSSGELFFPLFMIIYKYLYIYK